MQIEMPEDLTSTLPLARFGSAARNENHVVRIHANASTTPAPAVLIGACDQQTPISDRITLHTNNDNAATPVVQSFVAKSKRCLFVSWNYMADVLFQPPTGPQFPDEYIKIVPPTPHSLDSTTIIIPSQCS